MHPANEHTTVYNDNKNHPFSGKKIHKNAFISPITLCVTTGKKKVFMQTFLVKIQGLDQNKIISCIILQFGAMAS